MKRIIIDDVKINVSVSDFIERLYPEDDDDKIRIEEMWLEFLQTAKPRAVLKTVCADSVSQNGAVINGIFFESGKFHKNLQVGQTVFAYVASCSSEAEEWSRKYTDPVESYWASIMKEVTLEPLLEHLKNIINIMASSSNPYIVEMSPGSTDDDWALSEQSKLFELIGGASDIGVTLDPSFLMVPTKTVSGVYFQKTHSQTQGGSEEV